MITEMTGLPDGVIGFTAGGTFRAEDYRDVVLPAVERAADAGEVRAVIVLESFDGMTGGALWEDLKIGTQHLSSYKRIALVTDLAWVVHAASMFGWLTPGQLKHFARAQQDEAIAWAADTAES
jgi:hypothetical protein